MRSTTQPEPGQPEGRGRGEQQRKGEGREDTAPDFYNSHRHMCYFSGHPSTGGRGGSSLPSQTLLVPSIIHSFPHLHITPICSLLPIPPLFSSPLPYPPLPTLPLTCTAMYSPGTLKDSNIISAVYSLFSGVFSGGSVWEGRRWKGGEGRGKRRST